MDPNNDLKRDRTVPGGGWASSHQGAWDEDDGAALRRLREALAAGEGGYFLLDVPAHHGPFVIEVHTGTTWAENGSTIAEAADKCREALT